MHLCRGRASPNTMIVNFEQIKYQGAKWYNKVTVDSRSSFQDSARFSWFLTPPWMFSPVKEKMREQLESSRVRAHPPLHCVQESACQCSGWTVDRSLWAGAPANLRWFPGSFESQGWAGPPGIHEGVYGEGRRGCRASPQRGVEPCTSRLPWVDAGQWRNRGQSFILREAENLGLWGNIPYDITYVLLKILSKN